MGISKGGARLLLEETRHWPFSGSLLQLGRQQVFFGSDEIERLAKLHGVALQKNAIEQNAHAALGSEDWLDDGTFFAQLGFSNVESMDFSDNEKPTVVHDLNTPVSADLHNKYDTVFDGGTMEHVFDLRSVLRNICDLTKIGGRVIHLSPTSNQVDHGFYMFSPTFFFDYYMANGFKMHQMLLIEYTVDHNEVPWNIYEWEPGCLEPLVCQLHGRTAIATYFCAEKTPASTFDRIPQQGYYARTWADQNINTRQYERVRSAPRWPAPAPSSRSLIDKLFNRKKNAIYPIPNKIAEY